MTHVTCRLAAKNRDQLRNPTLGNRVWATFTFFSVNPILSTLGRLCHYDFTALAAIYNTIQSQTADSAAGVATSKVTLSARKVVPCVRWPATGITAHSL